jgi:hypothetical protein
MGTQWHSAECVMLFPRFIVCVICSGMGSDALSAAVRVRAYQPTLLPSQAVVAGCPCTPRARYSSDRLARRKCHAKAAGRSTGVYRTGAKKDLYRQLSGVVVELVWSLTPRT